jgi:hypothetical protein
MFVDGPSRQFGANPNLIATRDIADVNECTLPLLPRRRPLLKAEQFEVESAETRPPVSPIECGQVPVPVTDTCFTPRGILDRIEHLGDAEIDITGGALDLSYSSRRAIISHPFAPVASRQDTPIGASA